jgi:hypothetical protein
MEDHRFPYLYSNVTRIFLQGHPFRLLHIWSPYILSQTAIRLPHLTYTLPHCIPHYLKPIRPDKLPTFQYATLPASSLYPPCQSLRVAELPLWHTNPYSSYPISTLLTFNQRLLKILDEKATCHIHRVTTKTSFREGLAIV